MHSVNRYDDILEQESDANRRMYDGVSRPYEVCRPIQADPIQQLPDNPNPPFRLEVNLKTGDVSLVLSE